MTIRNIIPGFEATEIYPLGRSNLKQVPIKAVADDTGLTYFPLAYTQAQGGHSFVPSFSSEEMSYQCYQKEMKDSHFDEDEWYHLWLEMYQSEVGK